ncbi:MAG: HAMP domain-containing sensor histidine kinase [Bacteroidota bacterium]|nr:HAMP domain-containing sensor histidine kinase [Bacteroidota bacterium]
MVKHNEILKIYPVILKSLNAAVFYARDVQHFKLISETPVWIRSFLMDEDFKDEIDLSQFFPFLEIFIPDLFETDPGLNHKIYSDIWTEKNKQGMEKYLQAVGLNIEGEHYLLIISQEGSLYHDRELLQKGRENKLLTEKITRAKEELERLLKFKNQFVSIVSHDLRSPVSSVVSITNMMLADENFKAKIGEVYLDFVDNMNKDMQMLLEYNEKLYHWSNLQLGKFNLEPGMLEFRELAGLVRIRFMDKLEEKNIALEIETGDDIRFEADPSLFNTVLTNLVGNAVKFTPPNGRIRLTASEEKDFTRITVSDSGVGIKPEIAAKLFSGYVKEHKSGTNGEKGTGLGLGIVKSILDAHGFSIGLTSKVNQGTSFHIDIPKQ